MSVPPLAKRLKILAVAANAGCGAAGGASAAGAGPDAVDFTEPRAARQEAGAGRGAAGGASAADAGPDVVDVTESHAARLKSKGEEAVRCELTCHVCAGRMLQKIYQCRNGHVICEDCYAALGQTPRHCHVCRDKNPFGRSLALENIAASWACECPNAGCEWRGLGGAMPNHMKRCALIVECPEKRGPCDWSGRVEKAHEHLAGAHGFERLAMKLNRKEHLRLNLDDEEGRAGFCVSLDGISAGVTFLIQWSRPSGNDSSQIIRLAVMAATCDPAWAGRLRASIGISVRKDDPRQMRQAVDVDILCDSASAMLSAGHGLMVSGPAVSRAIAGADVFRNEVEIDIKIRANSNQNWRS